MKMKIVTATLAAALGAVTFSGSTLARKVCDDGTFPPCNKPDTGEAASNNLSYPVIWADGVLKPDFVSTSVPWVFRPVLGDAVGGYYTDVGNGPVYCVGENDITPPETVPQDVLCYYGRLNEGLSEDTGQPVLSGDPKVWWLQQRQPYNQWQVFNVVDPDPTTPLTVTGVDTGDLLESSIVIKAKQIRTEFTLLKNVDGDDEALAFYRQGDGGCVLDANDPGAQTSPSNCFAAHSMSGAVPGTDQSIAETQGTEYPTAEVLLDPRDVKSAKNYFDPDAVAPAAEEPGDPRIIPIDPPLGMDATVYSACARLLIQKVTGDPALLQWDSDARQWGPISAANNPVVDIKAWDGTYSAEINAGGSLIYGYNWNTKRLSEGAGAYRMTFLLEGDVANGGDCPHTRNTVFDATSRSVNVGERRPATLLSADALGGTHGEGGAVYVDIEIAPTSGGGGRAR